MKLNNRGFTLVEVLVVVVILAVIGGIAVKSVLSTINTSKDVSYKIMVKNIKSASKIMYEEVDNNSIISSDYVLYNYNNNGVTSNNIIISNNSISTNLQTLVSNGFLDGSNNECKEDSCTNKNKKIILNPNSKVDIGFCIIKITKNNNNYTISNESDTDSNCPSDSDYSEDN